MREILFRGKDRRDDKWVTGSFVKSERLEDDVISVGTSTIRVAYKVITETVGQYTGLQDKNGVRIFEGDILHYPAFKIDEEEIPESYVQVIWGDGGWETQETGFRAGDVLDSDTAKYVTVAGNIWDNPGLVEANR